MRKAVGYATPLLKWAGGKRWFADACGGILASRLAAGGRYFEPFTGGASVALWLGSHAPLAGSLDRMMLTDVLTPLVEFYTVVRDDPGGLAWTLSGLASPGVTKEDYLRVRDMRPETALGRAARLLYLNRLGFNGLYRENKSGDFNVPYGDAGYRASAVGRCSRDAIESLFPNLEKFHMVSRALKPALIGQSDFEAAIDCASAGDIVYTDPPYDGTFESYSSGGFGPGDQARLAAALARAAARGATIVTHNALTPLVQDLYHWATVLQVQEKRSIAAQGDKRGRAPCCVAVADADPTFKAEIMRALSC